MPSCSLEYHDDASNSHKFWHADVDGRIFRSKYGRLGSRPQHHETVCDTPAEALKLYQKTVQQKIDKGYKELGNQPPSAPPATPAPFEYRLYWKVVAHTQAITDEMVHSVFKRMFSLRAAIGAGRWSIATHVGDGGQTLSLTDVATSTEAQFGFMPLAMSQTLSVSDRQAHEERGINGYLSPSGLGVDGGFIQTDGLWLDLAVRSMLLMFHQEGAGIEINCDLKLPYLDGRINLPDKAQQPKFVWTAEWENLQAALDEHGLLMEVYRHQVQLKQALNALPPVNIW